MAVTLITVAMGAGGFFVAVATAGLCLSVGAGNTPEPPLIGLMVAGVVALVAGFVSSFERHAREWTSRTEMQLRNRRYALQLSRAVSTPSPPAHESKR